MLMAPIAVVAKLENEFSSERAAKGSPIAQRMRCGLRDKNGGTKMHPENSKVFTGSSHRLLTRRGLLQRAAWVLPATAFLGRWANAAQEVSPVMAKLSEYMAGARNTELPERVVVDAKHHILDTVAAMV